MSKLRVPISSNPTDAAVNITRAMFPSQVKEIGRSPKDVVWKDRIRQDAEELRELKETIAHLEFENHALREEVTYLKQPTAQAAWADLPFINESRRDRYVYTVGHSRICGTGIYLPEERVSTQSILREIDSKSRFGVSYQWIERITGIREKRVTPPGVLPSDMAVAAAREALERACITPKQIDVIIYAGVVRDHIEPATAHLVQAKLGATNAVVFDISNACNGFMNGMYVIDSLIATSGIRYGLVVTGEQGSLFTRHAIDVLKNTTDHSYLTSLATNLTAGDAGAAMVLGRKVVREAGFKGFMLQSRGEHAGLCTIGGPLKSGPAVCDMPTIIATGRDLMIEMFREFMHQRLGWRITELTKCLIHQTGTKGLFTVHELEGVPANIMPKSVDTLGNILSATIPLNIHHCLINEELRSGDKVYMCAGGSGISVCQGGLIWDGV